MKKLIAIGECMLELSSIKDDIWKMGIAGDTLILRGMQEHVCQKIGVFYSQLKLVRTLCRQKS